MSTTVREIRECVDTMARLQAEENLNAMTVTAMGSGMLKKSDAQRIRGEWQRAANRGEHRRMSKEQAQVMLATMGIAWRKN